MTIADFTVSHIVFILLYCRLVYGLFYTYYDAYWWCYRTDMLYILYIVFKFYFILGWLVYFVHTMMYTNWHVLYLVGHNPLLDLMNTKINWNWNWKDLRSFGILCSIEQLFLTNVSGQHIDTIFLDCLTLEGGTDCSFWNVNKKLPF